MKKILLFTIALPVVVVGLYAGDAVAAIYPTNASPSYTFDMGPDSWIDTSGTNEVLRLDVVSINPNLDNYIYTLQPGQSKRFYFATIGTTEGWINRDDIIPGSVNAYVDFDNPDLVQSIGGTSVGFSCFWHFFQGWNLIWRDPVSVSLDDGLGFTVSLSDVRYKSWFWQGPDGTAKIFATVTLNAIPLPATLILFGSGLLSLIGIRRKFSTKKYTNRVD